MWIRSIKSRAKPADGRARPRALRRNRLAVAVSAAAGTAALAQTGDVNAPSARAIEEVIVTATRRSASAQDVPIAVRAITGEALVALGLETFEDYVEFLPNVVGAGNGPGKKELYIRGSATEQSGVTVSTQQGSAPGVALYVDEQPVSFGGRNLDVYAVDLERIEVLAGPQGTLFGASSQSGNMRLITNKPNPAGLEASVHSRYAVTRGGSPSVAADAVLNLPIADALAARVAIYSDNEGGWIDNVAATFTPSAEVIDRNSAGYGPRLGTADSVASARNDGLVKEDWNRVSTRGGRLSLLVGTGENWEALLQHTAQTLTTEGVFIMDPNLARRHASATFTPDFNQDEFGLTTWTLQGRLANLDLVYAGGQLTRQVDSVVDYTHYNAGGGYVTYYLCSGNLSDPADPNNCYDPTKQFADDTANVRRTHEFRVSTDAARRWRLLAGVYVNETETTHVGDYLDAAVNDAHAEHINNFYDNSAGDGFMLGNIALKTAGVNSAGPRGPTVTFFNDFTRGEQELAFFGEVAVDLNDRWRLSLSARRYDLTTRLQGAANLSFGCRYGIGANAARTADGRCDGVDFSNDVSLRLRLLGQYAASGDDNLILDARSPNGEDGSPRDLFRGGGSNRATLDAIKSGQLSLAGLQPDGTIDERDTIIHATASWRPNDAVMFFAAFAEGYRPATLNRNGGQFANTQTGVFEGYAVPPVALTDHLFNVEAGMKGDFANGLLRINATAYRWVIEDLQLSRYDPVNVAFNYFIENVGDARARGLDVDAQWLATNALTLGGAFALLDTELTAVNPQLANVAVPAGADLPLAPTFSGNLRLRYDLPLARFGGDAWFAASVVHRGDSVAGMIGNAEYMDDTLFHQTGLRSGLEIRDEGGTFGNIAIPDASAVGAAGAANAESGRRLPRNTRFVNPAATTVNVSFGVAKGAWEAEIFACNVGGEPATTVQTGGRYMPVVAVQRPRSIGLRWSYRL